MVTKGGLIHMSLTIEENASRTQLMKQRVLDAPYTICIERARYVTQAWRETEGQHPSRRAAHAFENTLQNMTVFILDEERIAGNYCSAIVGTMLPVERGEMNLVLEMDIENLLSRPERPYAIDPDDKRELMGEILPWWRGRTVRAGKTRMFQERGLVMAPAFGPFSLYDLVRAFGPSRLWQSLGKFVKGRVRHLARASKEIPLNNPHLVNNVFDVQGHLVVGHNNVLPAGFKSIRDKADTILKSGVPEDKTEFLKSVITCCEATRMFAGRFAALARDKAEKEADPRRSSELLTMAEHCEHAPWNPPRSFHEAVQSLWLTEVMALISSGMAGICAIGRPDQYLFPFLEQDSIDAGDSLELVEELLIKLSNNLIMLPSFGKDTGSELGADSMAPTIGGVDRNGDDATNDLSFIFLDAIKNLRAMSNSYSVRVSKKTSPEFLAKVSEVHGVTSGIALFNDEAIIPALTGSGYTLEDARDYAIIGCVEPTSQGNTFGCTSGNDVSLAGALEMALNNGRLRMMGRACGPRTGNPVTFTSFDQVMDAFRKQLAWNVDLIAKCVNAKDDVYAAGFHNPYISCTFDGCVENGMDMTRGGARYNYASISGRGLATTADSLSAIKKFVFEEKKYTMKEMLAALRTNFRGRESMRADLAAHAPRYGSDNPEGDAMARSVAAMFCEEVLKQRSAVRGDALFRPGFFSYGMHVYDGSLLSATADGRPAGEPVSNSLSPCTGTETLGPTAVFRSAATLDHSRISNGCSLNMKLNPGLLATDEGRRKFEAMIRGYFSLGGMHVQFNVVDAKTLRAARDNPGAYKDLLVRVSGYAAYFTDLGVPLQEDIIRRTEFQGF